MKTPTLGARKRRPDDDEQPQEPKPAKFRPFLFIPHHQGDNGIDDVSSHPYAGLQWTQGEGPLPTLMVSVANGSAVTAHNCIVEVVFGPPPFESEGRGVVCCQRITIPGLSVGRVGFAFDPGPSQIGLRVRVHDPLADPEYEPWVSRPWRPRERHFATVPRLPGTAKESSARAGNRRSRRKR